MNIFRRRIYEHLFEILFKMHKIETIERIYTKHKNVELKELIFKVAIRICFDDNASETVKKSIRMICSDGNNKKLKLDDREDIYYISQFSGNYELFSILKEFDLTVNWGLLLYYSCNFLQETTIKFLVDNIHYSQKDIDHAFCAIITSSVAAGTNNPDQKKLISFFTKKFNPDVNQELDDDFGYLYFECFWRIPDSACEFYTDRFNIEIFECKDFWKEMISWLKSNEKNEYKKAFKDLKNSGLDISYIESVFAKEDKTALFEELTK